MKLPTFGLTKAEIKILFAVLSILTGLCTVAFFLHRNSQRLIKASEKIELSEEYKYHIQEILGISVDMETGVRGYVMTGDESYMLPVNNVIGDISLHLHQLRAVPRLTTEHLKQIDQLNELVDEKSTLATRTIELRRQKGMQEAMAFISEGKEKSLMDQIRAQSRTMLHEEDKLLMGSKEKHKTAIRNFAVTFYFMLLKISITVITVVVLLVLYIRRRNKSEKELKESHNLFQNVLDHSASIISIKDLSGRYMLINKAFEKQFNIRKEDVKSKTAYDFFPKDAANHIRDTDIEVVRAQQQQKVEENVPVKGEQVHFTSLKFPLLDMNKIPFAICSISTDETEKTLLEKQHKEEMNRIMDLFNNAPCGYQATDKSGIIVEMNETLLKWLGYTRDEVIGKMPIRNILSTESLDVLNYYFPRLRSGELKSLFDVEATYVRKDGTKFSIVANSVSQLDEDGNFLYTRTSIFDVSFRKRVEEVITHN
ncbi:MAG: CHASE3 domain-containing protein [Saprospiraceae bacterium]